MHIVTLRLKGTGMKRTWLFIAIFLFSFLALSAQPQLQLQLFASGLNNPVAIENAGDSRLFVVERPGYIRIIDSLGNVNPVPFLDIHSEIESGYDEQGLLGLAFHPDYADNGYFYVNYTDLSGNTVIARFQVSAADSNVADPASEYDIFTATQPYLNHNGGCVKFGPDGYLYFGLGDGGSAGDPGNRAQNPLNKLGKIHRIDVDSDDPYGIPADNPFAGNIDTLETIWDMGLRNPWRWSFDALTGDLWIGDVGQDAWEEVDLEPAGSGGGIDYGWRCYEGNHEFNTSGCAAMDTYQFPIFEYNHSYSTGGFAIIGGYVYRGSDYPGMYGYYITGDEVSGNFWTAYADGGAPYDFVRTNGLLTSVSTFGVDMHNELYCAKLSPGNIYRVTDACGDFSISIEGLSDTCSLSHGEADLNINEGTAPYDILWSTGESTDDITGLSAGTYSVTVTDNIGCVRTDSVMISSVASFTVDITQAGDTLQAETTASGAGYQWYENGMLITGATASTYVITESGNYYVEVTDDSGCMANSEEMLYQYTGIASPAWIHQISLFPNPSDGRAWIRVNAAQPAGKILCTVRDINGRIIIQTTEDLVSGMQTMALDLQSLSPGLYFISLDGAAFHWSGTLALQ